MFAWFMINEKKLRENMESVLVGKEIIIMTSFLEGMGVY